MSSNSNDGGGPAPDGEPESFNNGGPAPDDQALRDVENIIDDIVNGIDISPKKSEKSENSEKSEKPDQSVKFFDFIDQTIDSAYICRNCIAFHPKLPILVMGSCKTHGAGPGSPAEYAEYVSVWDVTQPQKKQRNFEFDTCIQGTTHFSFDSTGEHLVIASENTHLQMFKVACVLGTDACEMGSEVKHKECIGGGCAAVPSYKKNPVKEKYSNLSLSSLRCFAVNPTASEYDILTGYFSEFCVDDSTTGIFLSCSRECEEINLSKQIPSEIVSWPRISSEYKIKSLAFCYKPSDIPGVIFATGYRVEHDKNFRPKGMVQLCHYVHGGDKSAQVFSKEYNTHREILSIACHPALPIIAVGTETRTLILKYNPSDINEKDLHLVYEIQGLQANSIAFHPSLPILAITSLTRISLWLCETVHKYRVKELHFDMGSTIECIAFHPNPELNYMAAVSRNKTRVWNIEPIVKQLLSENPFKVLITIFGDIANRLIQRFTTERHQIVFRPTLVKRILSRVLAKVFPDSVHITEDSLYDILKLFFIINPKAHTGIILKKMFPPSRGGGSNGGKTKRKKWTIKKLKTNNKMKKPISRKMKLRNKSVNRRNRK